MLLTYHSQSPPGPHNGVYVITGLRWTGLDWTHKNVKNKLINHKANFNHTQNLTPYIYTLNFIFYKSF